MVRIRRAVQSDFDGLVELIREFYAADQHEFDPQRVRDAIVPLLTDDVFGHVWLVTDSSPGQLLGYAVVTWGWSLESGGKDAVLDEVYLRIRSTGLGEILLKHAMDAARQAGSKRMYLETELANERARGFMRLGFTADNSVWMSRDLGEEAPRASD